MADPQTETSRTIALSFLRHCFAGDMDAAKALLAPDATWWVLGDPEKVKVSGTRDMGKIERFLKNVRRGFPDGMAVTFEGVTAEGERVAVEAVSQATMADGNAYSNRYHFLVQVRDGRVLRMREYLDTHYCYEVQLASAPPPKA
jgi:ketosteroid isomerase-like protein